MALRRNAPLLAAVTVGESSTSSLFPPLHLQSRPEHFSSSTGIATGFYAFNQPLKQYSEDHGLGGDPRRSGSDGQSQVGGKGKG